MKSKTEHFFIIGNPRSGTSLLRNILNNHSSIVVPPECGFIHWWYHKYKSWSNNESKNKEAIHGFVNDLKTSRKIETWKLDFSLLETYLLKRNISSYNELCFQIIKFYGVSAGKINPQALGDKNNYYIAYLTALQKIAPTAKFIFLIRDPRDVACSYLDIHKLKTTSQYKPKLPANIHSFIDEWNKNHQAILDFTKKLNNKQYKYIYFEKLIDAPVKTLRVLTAFLKLNFEEHMLHYYKTNDEPEEFLDWKEKVIQPIDTTVVGRYVDVLSTFEQNLVLSKTESIYNKLKQKG